ncbi:MAG: TIGR02270 family protein [Steroidobacteraceae bacterium]
MTPSRVVPDVIFQHSQDAPFLYDVRTKLATAHDVKLKGLRRFDDRLAAHLDGLLVAGEQAWPLLNAGLATATAGTLFAATVMALAAKSSDHLNRLYALAEAIPHSQRGLISALGWVEQQQLRGVVKTLLASPNSFLRYLGVSACGLHRVDSGKAGDTVVEEPDSACRARGLRAAGEMGRQDVLPALLRMLTADDDASRFWSAWSAVLLGNRGAAPAVLSAFGEAPGLFQARAFRLSLQAMDQHGAQEWLRKLARSDVNLRLLIQGSGIAGDPKYIPWLIQHMTDVKTARLAGEALSLIAGLDLANTKLNRDPPDYADIGPNDDPDDANVVTDEDNGLPWPDQERISEWWQANVGRFEVGARYFLGAPVTRENCLRVLSDGFQRQRILAAHYLCLLEPGTTLFEWRAPAFRQQRLLATMV